MRQVKSLTSMRGLASLYVMLSHIYILGGAVGFLAVFLFGWSGVAFFFVLSGYLLIRKWLDGDYNDPQTGQPSLRVFYVKRIFRTWPLYYIVVGAASVLGVYAFSWISLVYLQEYLPSTFMPQAIWTMCAEEAFYFSLPLFMKFCFCSRTRSIIATVVAGALSVAWFEGATLFYPHSEIIFSIPFWFVAYCFGALLAWGIKIKFQWWVLVTMFLLFVFEYGGNQFSPLTGILVSGLYYLIIVGAENLKILEHKVFLWLGNISYSTYILHTYIIYAVGKILFHQSMNGITNLQPSSFVMPPWVIALVELGCLGLATATYYGIEQPFRNLGRKLA